MRYLLSLSFIALYIIPACSPRQSDTPLLFNQAASLPDSLLFHPLEWKVISSVIDKHDSTMSTLYGNDIAVLYTRTQKGGHYPPGAALCLVSWHQRKDDHWFGGRIPGNAGLVELVKFNTQDGLPRYEQYTTNPFRKVTDSSTVTAKDRITYITGMKAAVMP